MYVRKADMAVREGGSASGQRAHDVHTGALTWLLFKTALHKQLPVFSAYGACYLGCEDSKALQHLSSSVTGRDAWQEARVFIIRTPAGEGAGWDISTWSSLLLKPSTVLSPPFAQHSFKSWWLKTLTPPPPQHICLDINSPLLFRVIVHRNFSGVTS